MKQSIERTRQYLNDVMRKGCERIPEKKRRPFILGLCILFMAIFLGTIWDSFHRQEAQKILEMQHIEPLNLPMDTLNHKLKDVIHE